jgi:signal peptidase I
MKKCIVIVSFVILIGFTLYLAPVFLVPNEIKMNDISMNPTIPLGAVVRFEKVDKLERCDIIIYKSKKGLVISRIAAMPNEHVVLLESGIVIDFNIFYGFQDLRERGSERIHGKKFSGKEISKYEVKLSNDQFLVICDNQEIPVTGRVGGPISDNQIIGRITSVRFD